MGLNEEQIAIIKYVKDGMTNIEIGEELGYSADTIKKRLCQIYRLLNVRNRIDLIRKIFRSAC